MRILCSGDTRAKTANFSMSSSSISWGMKSSSGPVRARSPGRQMSSSRATAMAVARWSPVIITGRMPAWWHRSTAPFTSRRGGSAMPNSPRKVRSRSTVPLSSFLGCRDSSRRATPMTRRARRAMSSLAARICLRSAGDSGPLGPDTHRSSSTSGAPFTSTRRPPPSFSWTVVISLRPESKGISPVRGRLSDSWFRSSPSRAAATTSAPSVGVPRGYRGPLKRHSHQHLFSIRYIDCRPRQRQTFLYQRICQMRNLRDSYSAFLLTLPLFHILLPECHPLRCFPSCHHPYPH